MANLFAFALGVATARAEDRSTDDQIRRGVLMAVTPSPVVGAVVSRVVEDREASPPPPVITTTGAGTGGTSTAVAALTSSAIEDRLREVEDDVKSVKKDLKALSSRSPS